MLMANAAGSDSLITIYQLSNHSQNYSTDEDDSQYH